MCTVIWGRQTSRFPKICRSNYVFDCRGNFYQILCLLTGTSFIIPALLFNGEIFPPKVKVITTQSHSLVSVPAHNQTVHVIEPGGVVNVELTPRDFSLFIHSDKPVIVYIFMASAKVFLFLKICNLVIDLTTDNLPINDCIESCVFLNIFYTASSFTSIVAIEAKYSSNCRH